MSSNQNRAALLVVVLVAVALVLAGSAAAQGAQSERPALPAPSALQLSRTAEVRRLYAQSSWPESPARAGLPLRFALDGWRAGALQCEQGLVTRDFRRPAGDAPLFVVESRVADDAAGAQEQLVEWLAGVQSPARMPSGAELGLVLGDAAFAGRSGAAPGTLAWIAFVRANVAVRVSACDAPREPALDLAGVAQAIERALESTPPLAGGRTPAKPLVTLAPPASAAVTAGAVVRLAPEIQDPARGRPYVRWIVGGPGQGYVERAGDAWELHTTGPGALTLVLEVTGSRGTWTRQEVAFEVADD